MGGTVVGIYVTPDAGGVMQGVQSALAIAGQGLDGDRYAAGAGFYSATPTTEGARQLTLIELEAIDDVRTQGNVDLDETETRRNLVTEGVRLRELLGKRFTIGSVLCEGVRGCPPCNHLDELAGKSLMPLLVRTGGLRARIVEGGVITVGDRIEIVGDSQGTTHQEAGT